MPQPTQMYKVCPQCQSPADLSASTCLNCGRKYSSHTSASGTSGSTRKRNTLSLLSAMLLAVVLITIVWKRNNDRTIQRGDDVTLTSSGKGQYIPLAYSIDTFDRMTRLVYNPEDERYQTSILRQLLESREIFRVTDGTKAHVLNRDPERHMIFVHIAEGPFGYETGYVQEEWCLKGEHHEIISDTNAPH